MKVHELITILTKFNQNAEVIVSCDPEGNRFSPLDSDVQSDSVFDGESPRYKFLTEELKKQGFEDEDVWDGESPVSDCIVLWPSY